MSIDRFPLTELRAPVAQVVQSCHPVSQRAAQVRDEVSDHRRAQVTRVKLLRDVRRTENRGSPTSTGELYCYTTAYSEATRNKFLIQCTDKRGVIKMWGHSQVFQTMKVIVKIYDSYFKSPIKFTLFIAEISVMCEYREGRGGGNAKGMHIWGINGKYKL